MKRLIKDTARPIYKYIKDKNERAFNELYSKYAHKPRYKLHKDVLFLDYDCDIPDTLSFVWQFKEIFVDQIYNFKPLHGQKPVIYDCGANIGLGCLYFKYIYPDCKIIAFEADIDIAVHLYANLKKNNIEDVEIIEKAVWIDDKGVSFESDGADGGAVILNDPNSTKIIDKIDSVRLKDWLNKEERIDLLKIDIEGAELQVIEDCQDALGHIDYIFLEYHALQSLPQGLSRILNILEKNGFRYYIDNISKRNQPFINQGQDSNMDLQLNIFATRRS